MIRLSNSIFADNSRHHLCLPSLHFSTFLPSTGKKTTELEKTNSFVPAMHWFTLLLLALSAGLFLYIMVLETFLTDSQLTARTFKMSVDELRKPALNTAMKNLGVYNGLVGAGLLYALLFSPDGREVAAVFFAFGLSVAIYGAVTSQFSILFKQGTLPLLGLVSLVLL